MFWLQHPAGGYDGDDEADLLSHVSETSLISDADSNVDSDDVSTALVLDEVGYVPMSLWP